MTGFSNWDCREREHGIWNEKTEAQLLTALLLLPRNEALCSPWVAPFPSGVESCQAGCLWIPKGRQWRSPCKWKGFSIYRQKISLVTRGLLCSLFLITEDDGTVFRTKHSTCTGNKMAGLSSFRTSHYISISLWRFWIEFGETVEFCSLPLSLKH